MCNLQSASHIQNETQPTPPPHLAENSICAILSAVGLLIHVGGSRVGPNQINVIRAVDNSALNSSITFRAIKHAADFVAAHVKLEANHHFISSYARKHPTRNAFSYLGHKGKHTFQRGICSTVQGVAPRVTNDIEIALRRVDQNRLCIVITKSAAASSS